jgi:hypothetical protein
MVRTKIPAALTCLLLALVVTGCGSAKDDGKSSAGPKSATTSDAPGSHTRIVVHDAGAKPREQLRFALAEGSSQHATMTLQMGMAMTVNGRTAPTTKVPPMQMGMAVAIPEVAENGDVTGTFRYDNLKVLGKGAIADQMEAGLAPLAKVTGTIRTTNTGKLIDSDLDIPGDLNPTLKALMESMKEQLGNMMVPMPDEPVGVGATWTVHTESAIGGIKAEIEYSYTLVEHTGNRVVLSASYVQSVQEQDADLPTMPAGATTHVYASKVTGFGRTVLDLTDLFPVESSVETLGPVHMLVTQDGEKTDLVQRMHIKMKLSD